MDFDLEITFTGICAFVENADPRAEPRVCVVMPSTNIGGERNARDDEPLCSHDSYIEQGFGFASVKTPLKGQRVTFDYQMGVSSPGNPPLPSLPIATYNSVGLINVEDSGVLNKTDPSMVYISRPPSEPVAAQALLSNGYLSLTPEGNRWAIDPTDPNGVRVAHELTVTLKGLERAAAILSSFDGSQTRRVDLRPPTGVPTTALRIVNTCGRSTYSSGKRAYRDRDFKWYYEFLKDPDTISLGNGDLPIPRFVFGALIGGNNCFPSRLQPASIQ
jgi:hypothetical protein